MKYDDIIKMSRPQSKHKKMSIENRAAQFAPFAALTGYSASLKEAARMVSERKILSADMKQDINLKLGIAIENNLCVKIQYFKEDSLKKGGTYLEHECLIKRLDVLNNIIYFYDGVKIKLNDIYSVEIVKGDEMF